MNPDVQKPTENKARPPPTTAAAELERLMRMLVAPGDGGGRDEEFCRQLDDPEQE